MTERTVVTRLRAEVAQYKRDMASAAATTAAAAALMERSGGRATAGMAGLEKQSGSTSKALDSVSGRVGLAAHAIAMLGPAGATAGAVGASGLAAIVTQATALIAAGGVLIGVFQGVGGALKAVKAAQDDPTPETFTKAHEELQKLAPEARQAVLAMNEIRPALREIRDAGAAEFFPGFVDGLDDFATRADDVERLVANMSGALGGLAADAGAGLAGDDWDDFFDYLATDATTTVTDFGHTLGNLSRGVAELVMAFDPLSDGLSESMVSGSKGFAEWADGLSQTDGYREFVEYVQENGPQLGDTLVAIGDAFLQIGEAAAPLGGSVLSILEAVADVVASIADSDFGAPIMAGVAALSLLNRTLAMTGKLSGSAAISGAAGGGGLFGGMIAARSGINGLASDLKVLRRDVVAIGPATQQVAAATGRMSDRLAAAGKVGGGIAAVGLIASGAADQIGAANTATMALTGAMMGGPLGSAAGAAVGAFLDIKGSADDLRSSTEALGKSMKSGSFEQFTADLEAARAKVKDSEFQFNPLSDGFQAKDLLAGGALGQLDNLKAGWAHVSGAADEASEAVAKAEAQMVAADAVTADLARSLGLMKPPPAGTWDGLMTVFGETASAEDSLKVMERFGPAMDALGYSWQGLAAAQAGDPARYAQMTAQLQGWQAAAESSAGRVRTLADAVGEIDEATIPAADSAAKLQAALEGVFSPTLDAEAAKDAWLTSLRELRTELDKAAGFEGESEKAIKNREASNDYVRTVQDRLSTMAGLATTTEGDMARALEESRQRFIESGIAAGFSAEEMKKRANAMELTPKLIDTVFEAKGIDQAERKARALRQGYKALPPEVVTSLKTSGVDLSKAEIRSLKQQYDLTPKQVQTLVKLRDAGAKLGITDIGALMDALHNKKAIPKLDANPAPAKAKVDAATGWLGQFNAMTGTAHLNADNSSVAGSVNAAQAMVNSFTGKTVRITTIHAQTTVKQKQLAGGGYVEGPGTGTSDDIPAMLSNGEYVIPAVRVTQYGLGLMESLRTGSYELERQHFAKGGQATKKKSKKPKKLSEQEKRDIRAAQEFLREDEQAARIVKQARKAGRKAKSPGMAENSEFDLMAKPFIKDWEKQHRALEKQTKATEVQTSKLQDLISSQDDLKSSIMEAYQSDLFGGTDDGWSKPSKGPMGILDEDIRNINALSKAESRLDDVLKGDALAAVLKGPLADAQAMASWSNQQLAAYQAKFDQRTALAGGVAANAGQSAYGPMIAAQERATLAAERRELKMEKRLGRFEQRVDAWPQKFADALSKTARNAKGKGK